MSSSNSSLTFGGGGIGFVGALAILFITLKLLNKISWSWVWVLSPLWISGIFAIIILIIFGVIVWLCD